MMHFANPEYLLLLLVIVPLLVCWWFLIRDNSRNYRANLHKAEDYIDAHLLPHLLAGDNEIVNIAKNKNKKSLSNKFANLAKFYKIITVILLWSLGVLGVAGLRWDFKEVEVFSTHSSLVIALDLSSSMNKNEGKISRLKRAKQEIEDIIKEAQGLNIGLVAFAEIAHVVAPITAEKQTLLNLLPLLDSQLITKQGNNLAGALASAGKLLGSENVGGRKSVLIVSDGDLQSAKSELAKLKSQGVLVSSLGVGKAKNELKKLDKVAKLGGGIYRQGSYLKKDTQSLLAEFLGQNNLTDADGQGEGFSSKTVSGKHKIWAERFYIFVIPMAVILLLVMVFNSGNGLLLLLVSLFLVGEVQAEEVGGSWRQGIASYFKNKNQQAQSAFKNGEFLKAKNKFSESYNQGVASYKSGDFKTAETLFREGGSVKNTYNLANSQVMQGKLQEAVENYKKALEINPDFVEAEENLRLVEKLLREQEQKNKEQKDKNKDGDGDKGKDKGDSQEKGGKKDGASESSGKAEKGNSESGEQNSEDNSKSGKPNQGDDSQEKVNLDDIQNKYSSTQKEGEEGKNADDKPQEEQNKNASKGKEGDNVEEDGVRSIDALPQMSKEEILREMKAQQWLQRLESNPRYLLRNQFYIEEVLKKQ